jgi:flagellar biosynthesis component FlhA
MNEEKIEETKMEQEKKQKRDFYVEIALMLILGVLIGIAIKTEAGKRITIGFNDYKMKMPPQSYNISQLQKEQLEKMKKEAEAQAEAQAQNQNQDQNNPNSGEVLSGAACNEE